MELNKKTKISLILIGINFLLLLLVFLALQVPNPFWPLIYVQFFLICSLASLIVSEIVRRLVSNKAPWVVMIPIFGIVLYTIFSLSEWSGRIDNVIILPKNYNKDYVIMVYGTQTGTSINPNYEMRRKRIIKFPSTGIFLTSTELTSSLQQLNYPTIISANGDTLKGPFYDRFLVSNGKGFGYKYSIVNLSKKIIYGDSLFKAENIDFRELDKNK